jgi:hypothetical protein
MYWWSRWQNILLKGGDGKKIWWNDKTLNIFKWMQNEMMTKKPLPTNISHATSNHWLTLILNPMMLVKLKPIFFIVYWVQMRYNVPIWLLKKRTLCFFPKKTFFTSMNFGTIFLQLVIINVNSCPSTWHVFFFIIFFKIWIFESVLIPCKFTVSFFKMMIISNHYIILI